MIADFKRIRNEGLYYVDKTEYLALLEERDSFVFFVRPRRFGKSLFISMMQSYYDRRESENFEKLFGGLWLGEHPTENRNRYLVLALDFSKAGATGEFPFELVESFPAEAVVEPGNFRSLFHYYGILSMAERREGMTYFRIPNACVEQQLFNYLRDSYRRVKPPDWIGWSKLASGMAYRGEWEPFLRRLEEIQRT